MMDGFGITCRCGHWDGYDEFMHDAQGAMLPAGEYRCPACGVQWLLRPTGPARILDNGLEIPAPREVVLR